MQVLIKNAGASWPFLFIYLFI